MSFKNLSLKRERIPEAIQSFPDVTHVTSDPLKNHMIKHLIKVKGEQNPALLCEYHSADGNTTLHFAVGKNQNLSEKVAEHIANLCEYVQYNYNTLYLKNIEDEEYEALMEMLAHYKVKVTKEKDLQLGKQYKIDWPDGGSLFLNRFNSGSFQVQGASKILKSIVVEVLTELLPYKEVIEMQLKSFKTSITTDEVLIELQNIIPTAYGYLGNTLITIMSPSIALKSLEIELKDYSAFVFPVLKGIEGYIKKLFIDNSVPIEELTLGSYIETLPTGVVQVIEKHKITINNSKTVSAIEEAYSYYKKQRHGLFHIDGTIDSTRIIESKKEAIEIMTDVFQIIETSYSKI